MVPLFVKTHRSRRREGFIAVMTAEGSLSCMLGSHMRVQYLANGNDLTEYRNYHGYCVLNAPSTVE